MYTIIILSIWYVGLNHNFIYRIRNKYWYEIFNKDISIINKRERERERENKVHIVKYDQIIVNNK